MSDVPLTQCPKCWATPFNPFLRFQITRTTWKFWKPVEFCLICWKCKEIVGYERTGTPGKGGER